MNPFVSDDPGRAFFETAAVVNSYDRSDLRAGEIAILDSLKEELRGARVLDLGVGGGRTTPYFLPLADLYVGLDYSQPMVQRCQQRFASASARVRFMHGDARRLLDYFKPTSFDFVLFSFNGIDHVAHEDRLACLRQVHAVLRGGGSFCFSSHNLERGDFSRRALPAASTRNPLKWLYRLCRALQFRAQWRWHNPHRSLASIQRQGCGMIYEQMERGCGPFVPVYYVSRQEAARQLSETGFSLVAVHSDVTGAPAGADTSDDRWLYYFCQKA